MDPIPAPAQRLAVMQPYLFPYLGYFQLMAASDRFVAYDDVSYIRQGWVNRNRVLVQGQPYLFTLPVRGASSFIPIDQVELDAGQYKAWRERFMRTLEQAYARAPHAGEVIPWLRELLDEPHARLVDLLRATLRSTMDRLGLRTAFVPSSRPYANQQLHGQERILDICRQEGASRYINAIGGMELYDRAVFASRGIELSFLRSRLPAYPQGRHPFVPGLSILDALMHVDAQRMQAMLHEYDLE